MPRCAVLLAALLLTSLAHADKSPRDVTVDDYFTLATITDLALSPDGDHVTYCEARWQESSNDRKADLWVVANNAKARPRRLTGDRAGDRHPRWAADGKSVYVLGNRKRTGETKAPYDGTAQVWQIRLDGSDPRPITRVEGGVASYDYAKDTNAIVYVVDAKATDDDVFGKLRSTFSKLEYGHGTRKVSEVRRLDLDTWRDEQLVAEKRYVREMAVTRNGKRIAMITAPDDTVITSEGRSRVDVWDASSGKVSGTDESWRKTAASPYPWLEALAWNPDGSRLAYATIFDAYPAEVIVNTWSGSDPVAARMKRHDEVQVHGYGSPLCWADQDWLLYLGDVAGRVPLMRFNAKSNAIEGEIESQTVVVAFDALDSKRIVQVRSTPTAFPELFGFDGQLTNLNPQTKEWKLPEVKHVTWNAADGDKVGGILELPPSYVPGQKLPLIVGIHGGPTTSVKVGLEFNPYDGRLYFASRGYAVLCPNYRGSTGYGDKFVTDLIGNENDVDVKDIVAGIKHLINEGIVDPERVAVMGWSNGGYLTNCLITMKEPPVKIRAASSGASILDCVAEWGFNDEPAYPMVFKKGLPWETPEIYRKTSPTYGLGNVRTPTLIHVGANDERCPPGHSRMLYRALKEYVKVPTQLIVYPGEPHGLGKYLHRKAKMEWDLAWFDVHVLDREPQAGGAKESVAGILELKLPKSSDPPTWAPERVSKLEIDGTDHSTPRNETRSIKVDTKKGSDSVTVVYTFWPNTYTRFIRTKKVKVEKGKTVEVDMTKTDPDNPDKIYVIYVPTPDAVVDAMCKLAKIGKDDVVYDIGCGDGRMVIQAVKKYGAKKAIGIDINEERIKECRENAKKAGVEDKVTFLHKDALTIKDFSEASVVLTYLSNPLMEALRPTLQKTMKENSRIVSHRFLMGDWKPEKTEKLRAKDLDGDEDDFEIHLWTIKKRP